LTLGVSSSIAILRQHRMDPRLLNPKIARRGVVEIENGPQTWITQGSGCNGHPPVLAKRPITSMIGAKSDYLQPYLDPQGLRPLRASARTPPRDAITSVTPSAFGSPKPDRYHLRQRQYLSTILKNY
jgi:hypothetical protein